MVRSLITLLLIISILAFVVVSGCPNAGGSHGVVAVPAPVLSGYTVNPATYTVGDPLTPNAPLIQGKVESYKITPALPAGLVFHSDRGSQ